MIKLKDGRSELYQWDTGRTMTVGEGITEVHYAIKPYGRSIDVPAVDSEAVIPDVLLQSPGKLYVWAFVGGELDGYTKLEKEIEIRRRNKPADYVFTPPDQTTLAAIMEEFGEVKAAVTPEAVGALVAEYLRENPVSGLVEVDDTLTQAGQAADAAKVGEVVEQLSETIADKLDADKLPEAVNDALAQAKASGEFDGKTPVKSVDYLTPEEVAEIVEDAAVRAAELVDVPEGGGGSGGGELPKLVGKYVHSENKEIRPTALDLPTGVFTCASHGLNTGDPAMVVLDGLFRNIPYELISTTRVSDTHFTIRSIDNDTFTLQFAGDDITYPSELNTQIDVSKWHIEIAKKQIIVIEGFSAESVEVRFNGSYWGTSNYHLDISPVSNRTRLNTVYGGYDGRLRTTSNDTSICLSVEGILRVNNCVVLESSTIVPKTSASDYTYMVNNPDIAYNRVNEKHSTNIVPLTGRQVVNGIAIAQHYNGGHGAMLANGFTVEIYKYA